jgi:hypothetical protein
VVFRRPHQPFAVAGASGAPVHQHLGDVAAMRLVGLVGGDELDGAHEPFAVVCGEQVNLSGLDGVGDAGEEADAFRHREPVHEADRRAACHAVDEHGGKLGNPLSRLLRAQQANRVHAVSTSLVATVESAFSR